MVRLSDMDTDLPDGTAASLLDSLGSADRRLIRRYGGSIETGETGGEFIAISGAAITRDGEGWRVVDRQGRETRRLPSLEAALARIRDRATPGLSSWATASPASR